MSSSDLPKLWATSSNISKFVLSKSLFCVKNWSKLSEKRFYDEYLQGDQILLIIIIFLILIFKILYFIKLRPIFVSSVHLVSLTMTRFSEKMLIFTRYMHGFMSNLIKKSWMDSNTQHTTNFCIYIIYLMGHFQLVNNYKGCCRSHDLL